MRQWMRMGLLGQGLRQFAQEVLTGKQNLIGIEIGSAGGLSAEIFLSTGAFSQLNCIDPWEGDYAEGDYCPAEWSRQQETDFDRRFRFNPKVRKIKNYSTSVKDLFEDSSIDFIYIDGCHTYGAVKEDLTNYVPKIKIGGIIAGHDFEPEGHIQHRHVAGVAVAVLEQFKKDPVKVFPDNSWYYIKEE